MSRATDDGTGAVRLNASKSFVTSAGHADGYVTSTLAAGATTALESTIYLVLGGDAGLSVAGAWSGLGLRGNASAPMTLEHVTVGADRALSDPGCRSRWHRGCGRAGDDRARDAGAARAHEQLAGGAADAAGADRAHYDFIGRALCGMEVF